jgi:hypothetical protein
MRRSVVVSILAAAALGVGSLTAATTAAAISVPAAVRVSTVRPVTTAGRAAPGFSVTNQKSGVDCADGDASLAAVDADILFCAPDAAYAIACWKSATAHHVLCLRNATSKQLVKLPARGAIPSTEPRTHPTPLNLRLANGRYCELRDGGAGSSLRNRPNWSAFYYCTGNTAVWAPLNATNFGILKSGQQWTVRVGAASGNGPLTKVSVTRAYYVGNHS